MKFRFHLTLFFILTISGFSGVVFGQGNVSWRDATKEPISRLVIDFGKVADLNYTDEDTIDFGLTEKRENLIGIDKFKKTMVLPREAADSSLYRMDRIINFIDTTYVRLYNEIAACENENTRDSLIKLFENNKSVYKYISIEEYISKIKKLYNRDNISEQVLPGIASGMETSAITDVEKMNKVFIAEQRQRLTSTKWMTKASANFDFIGFYLDKNNQQMHIDLHEAKLVFDISFDEVKTSEGKVYTNFRIERVLHPMTITGMVGEKYLFTVQPFVSGGLRNINGSFTSNDLEKETQFGNAWVYEAGVLFERKMKPFGNNQFVYVTIGTGVTFSQFIVNSSVSDDYNENYTDLELRPFDGYDDFLTNYTIQSKFDDVSYKDINTFLGIPVKLGIGFKMDANNRIRGYLSTTFTYHLPLNSRTKTEGSVDQTGIFEYKFNEDGIDKEYTVTIGGENNPLPQFYGKNDAVNKEPVNWKNGMVSKTELGMNFRLKGRNFLNIGPYFSLGSYQLKNTPRLLLADYGGVVSSPLSAMDKKVSFIGYGMSLSVLFDVIKLSAK